MQFIRINFIQDKIDLVNRIKLRKALITLYGTAWFLVLWIFISGYTATREQIRYYSTRVDSLRQVITEVSPQYELGIELFEDTGKLRTAVAGLTNGTISLDFLRYTLRQLITELPTTIWLEEVAISKQMEEDDETFEEFGEEDDPELGAYSMTIKGKSRTQSENPEEAKLKQYLGSISDVAPFGLSQSRIDLSNMTLIKNNDGYVHSFAMEFVWSNIIL